MQTKTKPPVTNTNVLCPVLLFRFFFRKTFSSIDANNEDLDEINLQFTEYLRNKCTAEQLAAFIPTNEIEVLINQYHPLKTHGFEPAFILHFLQFVEKMKTIKN